MNFTLFDNPEADRSINRIVKQYAVIANCDSTRVSYSTSRLENCISCKFVCLVVNTTVFASAAVHDSRVDHVKIRFAGSAELFGRFRTARKRRRIRMKTNGMQ